MEESGEDFESEANERFDIAAREARDVRGISRRSTQGGSMFMKEREQKAKKTLEKADLEA